MDLIDSTSEWRARENISRLAMGIWRHYWIKGCVSNLQRCVLFYKSLGLSYTYIPKNACSTLKRTFGVAEGGHSRWVSPHKKQSQFFSSCISDHLLARRLIIFRNPFQRAVSVYLDKIAHPVEQFAYDLCCRILISQRGVDQKFCAQNIADGKTPTFGEFVAFLSFNPDEILNEHLKSQCSFISFENYDDIFALEGLNQLWRRYPYKEIQMIKVMENSVTRGRRVIGEIGLSGGLNSLSSRFGGELIKDLKGTRSIPAAHLFFDNPAIVEKFCARFRDDIILYRELFPLICERDNCRILFTSPS